MITIRTYTTKAFCQVALLLAVGASPVGCGGDEASSSTTPPDDTAETVQVDGGDDAGVCTPGCDGKACGDDGCGGVCGECKPGDRCTEAGVCEAQTLSCDSYCSRVMDACTGDKQQYPTVEACVSWCAASYWEIGAVDDADIASLGCHNGFALKAETDASKCGDAGPLSEACGGGCWAYCEGALGFCTGDSVLYEALDSCLGYCDFFHPTVTLSATGNTLGCRLYHLGQGLVGKEPAAEACAAASPEGADTCVSKPPPNDTCETAIVIDKLPFTHSGDTSAGTPDYETGAGCCLPENPDPTLLDICALDGDTLGGALNDVVYKMTAPTRSVCPQCREVKLPHQVCAKCGFYKGREILSVEGE